MKTKLITFDWHTIALQHLVAIEEKIDTDFDDEYRVYLYTTEDFYVESYDILWWAEERKQQLLKVWEEFLNNK